MFDSAPLSRSESDAPADAEAPSATPGRLRLLSYNIQAGIAISGYHHYVTHSWKHVLPFPDRCDNLDRIAALVADFDFVALQEVDAGSLRSGFINQTKYLSLRARFPYWYDQTNRRLGHFARHSIGLLSRFKPDVVLEHKLPGMIPGRGALLACFERAAQSLAILVVHLALGRRGRARQLAYIADVVREHPNIVVMGDLNCPIDSREACGLLDRTGLIGWHETVHTYPSWRPSRSLDHILVSPSLTVEKAEVLDCPFSDHLPITMDISLPPAGFAAHRANAAVRYPQ